MMKIRKRHIFVMSLALVNCPRVFAEKSIECLVTAVVTPSTNYPEPVTKGTSIKNDSFPMLLIGIHIQDAYAIYDSKKLKSHQKYCASLIGKQKDAFLSGPHQQKNITIKLGDHLKLRNIHSSGKSYPYWPDFYYEQKSDSNSE